MGRPSRRELRESIYQRELQRLGHVPCYVCRGHVPREEASLEHIWPKAFGGSNAKRNLTISHRACNSRRGHKLLAHVVSRASLKASAMETFVQPRITGYRQLSEHEAALMNEIKLHAEQTRELVGRVQHHIEAELAKPLPEGHAPHSSVTHPARWAAEAQTDLQKGFMCLVRAVARPSTF